MALVGLSVALNVGFVATWAVHVLGRDRRPPFCQPRGGRCGIHVRLGTTDEQWAKVRPLIERFRESARETCAEANRHRAELFGLLAAEPVDREAVRAKQEEIISCQRRMQELVIEHMLKQKEVLNPGQREEFFRMLKERTSCPGHGTLGPAGRPTGGPGGCAPLAGD
jgi:Spy/CpxP family protein refolding chaperone